MLRRALGRVVALRDMALDSAPEIAAPPRPASRLSGLSLAWRLVFALALLGVAVALPQIYGQTTTKLFAQAIYLAVAAMGLNLLTGFNGQVSVGHGAFFGFGAYASAILVFNHGWSFYWTLPVVALLTAVVGAAVGFPALRIKGLYLALITLGLAALLPLFVTKYVNGAGGTTLVQPNPPVTPNWVPISWIPQGADDIWRYYVSLAVAIVGFVVIRNIVHSRVGRAIIAIRDREVAAETVGVNLSQFKVATFAVSAAYAGVAGALSVMIDGVAQSSQLIFFQLSIEFLVAVVIGGAATLAGPLLGAIVVVFLQDRTMHISDNEVLAPAVFGGLLILVMYVVPDGIVGGVRRLTAILLRRFTSRKGDAPLAPSPATSNP